jgi:hypothetical protein
MFCLYGSAREGTVAILQACDSNDESCQEGEGLTSVVPRLRKDPIVEVDTVLHCTPFIFFVVTASKSAASRQIDIRNLAHYMSFIRWKRADSFKAPARACGTTLRMA